MKKILSKKLIINDHLNEIVGGHYKGHSRTNRRSTPSLGRKSGRRWNHISSYGSPLTANWKKDGGHHWQNKEKSWTNFWSELKSWN